MSGHTPEFWKKRIGEAAGVKHWRLYSYEYLDDLSFMPLARDLFDGWDEGKKIVDEVEERLKKFGWDGDGELQVMWLPPFAGAGPQNNFGCYALHVKQIEDGISWIASPYALPFHRLFGDEDAMFLPAGVSSAESANWRTGSLVWSTKFIGSLDSDLPDASA